MPSDAFKTLVAANAQNHVTHLSLHTTDHPSGGDEFAGGNYGRQVPSYEAGDAGIQDLETPVEFGGPGSSSAANFLGHWATSTWLGAVAIPSPPTMTEDDTLEIDSAPIAV